MPIINNTLIQRAIANAQSSLIRSFRHGAIMFDKNKIYSEGHNSSNRTYLNGMITPSIHAEMQCVHNHYKNFSLQRKGPSKKV